MLVPVQGHRKLGETDCIEHKKRRKLSIVQDNTAVQKEWFKAKINK